MRKWVWSQRNLSSAESNGPLSSSDIQEITVGSSPGTWITRSNPSCQNQKDRMCPGKGAVELSGRLVGVITNFYGAAKLVVDAIAKCALASLWLLPLSRTRGDWQHQQIVSFLLKELRHLKIDKLIQEFFLNNPNYLILKIRKNCRKSIFRNWVSPPWNPLLSATSLFGVSHDSPSSCPPRDCQALISLGGLIPSVSQWHTPTWFT